MPAYRLSISSAERCAIAGAALLVLLHALGPGALALLDAAALEYRGDTLARMPWRLLTAHLVHINWPHALINAAAWWVVARLFAPELPPARQVAVLLTAALVIGLGLALAYPGIAWYRGFSGVLHALFFAGTVAWLAATLRRLRAARNADRPLAPRALLQALWLPAVLLVGGAVKVIAEQPAGSTTPYADWLGSGTVPQAHLLGGLVGALFGALWGLRSPAPMQGRPT